MRECAPEKRPGGERSSATILLAREGSRPQVQAAGVLGTQVQFAGLTSGAVEELGGLAPHPVPTLSSTT